MWSYSVTQKNINFVAKVQLWEQTVLTKQCTILWNMLRGDNIYP